MTTEKIISQDAARKLLEVCKALLAVVERDNPYWHGRTDGLDIQARLAIAAAEGS